MKFFRILVVLLGSKKSPQTYNKCVCDANYKRGGRLQIKLSGTGTNILTEKEYLFDIFYIFGYYLNIT